MAFVVKKASSPFWIARFRDPTTGRIVQQSTGESSRRTAEKRAGELEAGYLASLELTKKGALATVHQVAEQYYESELKKRKWAATAGTYIAKIELFLGSDKPYCATTIADVAAFIDTIEETMAPATINRVLACWRRMHNYARDVREYPVKPILFKKLMRDEPAGRTRNLTPEELETFLRHLPERGQEIAIFGVSTGVRKAQIKGLTWDRVDLVHRTARVTLKHKKDYVQHTVDLNDTAMKIIERRLAARDREALPAPKDGRSLRAKPRGNLVFDVTNFEHEWKQAIKDSGIADFRFHDLRHTFATWMARKAPLVVVQRSLGHSNITTTLRYAHVQRDDLREAALTLTDVNPQKPRA